MLGLPMSMHQNHLLRVVNCSAVQLQNQVAELQICIQSASHLHQCCNSVMQISHSFAQPSLSNSLTGALSSGSSIARSVQIYGNPFLGIKSQPPMQAISAA